MLRTLGMFAAVGLAAGGCTDGIDYSVMTSEIDIDAFVMPMLPAAERAQIVRRYDHLDPADEVPRGLLEDAMVYFDMNLALIPKQRYFVVMDMSLFSGKDRFWLVDLMTGEVEAHKVAHGDGSDPDHDGYADSFGNVEGSHKSSLGFYLSGEIYDGTHDHSMRLDGLNRDGSPNGLANSNARPRLIVMHEASYVSDSNTDKQGRSNGCPALDPTIEVGVVDKIHDGSLLYMATSPLNPPVGRADPGPGDDPEEMPPDDDMIDDGAEMGGCSAGGGGTGPGVLVALGLAAVSRRRRR
ncbi:MAG: murein L,D-transpeptidase catalytic domain-containing protein [Kofleriaceae bacterium]